MSDNCSNCVQAKMLDKVDERVSKLEEKCQVMQDKLAEIETSKDRLSKVQSLVAVNTVQETAVTDVNVAAQV